MHGLTTSCCCYYYFDRGCSVQNLEKKGKMNKNNNMDFFCLKLYLCFFVDKVIKTLQVTQLITNTYMQSKPI